MATPVMRRGQMIGTRSGGVMYGTSFAQAQVFWEDDWLKAAGVRAFRGASYDVRDAARRLSHSKRIVPKTISARLFSGGAATMMDVAAIVRASSPLAHLLELGTEPHNIAPKGSLAATIARGRSRTRGGGVRQTGKKAMVINGSFVRGTVRHPGTPEYPFMRPAAALFPRFFNTQLARQLRF